jgi:hypothetical protein
MQHEPRRGTEEELPQKGTKGTENRKTVFLRNYFVLFVPFCG